MTPKSILCLFGLGYLRHSASLASLAAIPVYYVICAHEEQSRYINAAFFLGVLLWSMAELRRVPQLARTDPREIVVDEFLGMYCALMLSSLLDLPSIGLLLVIFRLIDRFKIFPFDVIEKNLRGPYGLLWDDIAIGVCSGLLFNIAARFLSS